MFRFYEYFLVRPFVCCACFLDNGRHYDEFPFLMKKAPAGNAKPAGVVGELPGSSTLAAHFFGGGENCAAWEKLEVVVTVRAVENMGVPVRRRETSIFQCIFFSFHLFNV